MNVRLKKHGRGEVELDAFGLNLKVNPQQLIQLSMNENAQRMLDKFIEDKFRNALKEFELWYDKNYVPNENKDLIKACEELDQRFKYNEHIQEIQDVADIVRYLMPLHTDCEIQLTPEQDEVFNTSMQFWEYNQNYGHKSIQETEIKNQ